MTVGSMCVCVAQNLAQLREFVFGFEQGSKFVSCDRREKKYVWPPASSFMPEVPLSEEIKSTLLQGQHPATKSLRKCFFPKHNATLTHWEFSLELQLQRSVFRDNHPVKNLA